MLPLLFALLLGPAPAPAAEPLRLSSKAFGKPAEIEVRDLAGEAARAAIQKAFAEIAEIERLTDAVRPDGGLTALNAAAGKGPQPVDARLLAVLARASDFCTWSEGAHGPLGRDLYALWGLRAPVAEPPKVERFDQAVDLTACGGLTLDKEKGTATLAPGAGLDLWGFAEGHAVDGAVDVLRREGVGNGVVRLGAIERGFGPGPAGEGWPAALPKLPGLEESPGPILLHDRSLAVASQADHPRQSADAAASPAYVNQRTGRPAQGVLAAATVTDLAMDAQGLAAALLLTGPREGQMRLGSLRPRPSVLWFLGSGEGPPLQVGYRWGEVSRK
jgi:FAD:protein FMN transferase